MTWNTDFQDDEHFERRIEEACDFISDGDSAAGQCKHDRALAFERQKGLAKCSASFTAIQVLMTHTDSRVQDVNRHDQVKYQGLAAFPFLGAGKNTR